METVEKRLAAVAARLLASRLPEHFTFNMKNYKQSNYPDCGTSGCIAGLAVAMFDPTLYQQSDAGNCYDLASIEKRAAALLELDVFQRDHLFAPYGLSVPLSSITEVQAGRVLAHYIRTGEIDWVVMDKPVKVAGRTF